MLGKIGNGSKEDVVCGGGSVFVASVKAMHRKNVDWTATQCARRPARGRPVSCPAQGIRGGSSACVYGSSRSCCDELLLLCPPIIRTISFDALLLAPPIPHPCAPDPRRTLQEGVREGRDDGAMVTSSSSTCKKAAGGSNKKNAAAAAAKKQPAQTAGAGSKKGKAAAAASSASVKGAKKKKVTREARKGQYTWFVEGLTSLISKKNVPTHTPQAPTAASSKGKGKKQQAQPSPPELAPKLSLAEATVRSLHAVCRCAGARHGFQPLPTHSTQLTGP